MQQAYVRSVFQIHDPSVWHLLLPFAKSDGDKLSSRELTVEAFLDSLRPFRIKGEPSLIIDLKQHLEATGSIGACINIVQSLLLMGHALHTGKGGYDSNLEKVEGRPLCVPNCFGYMVLSVFIYMQCAMQLEK